MIISFHRGSVLQSFAHYSFAARELSRHNESAADETTRRDISPPQCCTVYKYQNVTTVLLLSELRRFIVVRVCVCVRCSCSALDSVPTDTVVGVTVP